MSMVYVTKMRELADLAVAEAEAAFAQNKTATGIDWLLTAHRMARHTGAGDMYISFIVQSLIDELAMQSAARHCLAWDEATRHGYAEKVQALPPLHTWQDSYRYDQAVITDYLERVSQTEGPQRTEVLTQMMRGSLINDEKREPAKSKEDDPVQWDAVKWREELATFRSLQGRAAAAFAKPWPEGQAEMETLRKSVDDGKFSLFRETYTDADNLYRRNCTTETLHTMLEVALRYGAAITEADAASYRDSIEGEPLRLQKDDHGSMSLVAAKPRLNGKTIELKLGR